MATGNAEVIRTAYEAFGRQDIPAVLAAFDEQIEWVVSDALPFGGEYHGHEGVLHFFNQLPGYFGDMSVEPQELIEAGDVVVAVTRLRGTGAVTRTDTEAVHLWRMRDGKAVSMHEYSDTARALEALGLAPAPARAGASA